LPDDPVRLIRELYEIDLDFEDVRKLCLLIELPEPLASQHRQDVEQYEEGRRMPSSRVMSGTECGK
jgi:hypothetical protein